MTQPYWSGARRARNGGTFSRLWAGDTSAHGGDDSAADLALCNLLAFWTGRDAERMDRLFRQSGLMREKWDQRHGAQTMAPGRLRRPLRVAARPTADSRTGATGGRGTEGRDTHAAARLYVHAGRSGCTLRGALDCLRQRPDGCGARVPRGRQPVPVAAATPTVRAQLGPYPNGLPTNLYLLLLGDSTTSRKSTSKDLARDVQDRALPGSLSADQFSPEGLSKTSPVGRGTR